MLHDVTGDHLVLPCVKHMPERVHQQPHLLLQEGLGLCREKGGGATTNEEASQGTVFTIYLHS